VHWPGQIEVERLVKFIAALGVTTGIVFFIIGITRACTDAGGCDSNAIVNAFVNGFILVLVANVPEGLPATVMSCLTITAQRLKDKNVLIKRADIIENLGAATVWHATSPGIIEPTPTP
jgi:sodium/potassium-transporting ATPase subunit alpha